MTEVEVRKMAHKFMVNMNLDQVDTDHDNVMNNSVVVESFIARKDDPDFIENSWVAGIWVKDPEVWQAVKSGGLNGFSFEAMARHVESELEVQVPDAIDGHTSKSDGHEHEFTVFFNDDGSLLGGYTDVVKGHQHNIERGTITSPAEDGHTHRYSFTEGLISVET